MPITDAIFEGSGPYAIPLLAKYISLTIPDQKSDFVLAQFQFEDGATLHVPISIRAAELAGEVFSVLTIKGMTKKRGEEN